MNKDDNSKIIDYLLGKNTSNKPLINQVTNIQHWLIRIGDGINFNNSREHNLWGFNDHVFSKHFISNARPNDTLWFVTANSKGHIIAFAKYQSYNKKVDEPIYNTNLSNGWNKYKHYSNEWKTVIHYNDYHDIADAKVLSHIKGTSPIRLYKYNLSINLDDIYNNYN